LIDHSRILPPSFVVIAALVATIPLLHPFMDTAAGMAGSIGVTMLVIACLPGDYCP
jgi:hypothetical protein